jgi:hypothetical protein
MKKIIDKIRAMILTPFMLAAFLLCFIAVLVWAGVMILRGSYDIFDAKQKIMDCIDVLLD